MKTVKIRLKESGSKKICGSDAMIGQVIFATELGGRVSVQRTEKETPINLREGDFELLEWIPPSK